MRTPGERLRLGGLVALVAAVVSTAILLGVLAGPSAAHPRPRTVASVAITGHDAEPQSDLATPAGRLIRDLTGGNPGQVLASLPATFTREMGYRPALEGGYPVDPNGGCSSPVPMPSQFQPLCRTHDFGYDILRFADREGHPLGGWARVMLDRQLVERMHDSCATQLCNLDATAAGIGLGFNTWRQRGGVPRAETMTQIMSSTFDRVWPEADPDRPVVDS